MRHASAVLISTQVHPNSSNWRTVIYFTIDHPPPPDHRSTSLDVNALPYHTACHRYLPCSVTAQTHKYLNTTPSGDGTDTMAQIADIDAQHGELSYDGAGGFATRA